MTQYGDVPLRLSDAERESLQLLISALKVSEYTDDVDDIRRSNSREERIYRSMCEFFDIVWGLCIAAGIESREFKEDFLKGSTAAGMNKNNLIRLFEIFRRHKRLNPFANRNEFGKLTMLLQDIQKGSIQQRLMIPKSLITPVHTVDMELKKIGAEILLKDDKLKAYLDSSGTKKAEVLQHLVAEYGNAKNDLTVERCLRSIDDVHEFINSNIAPLRWLEKVLIEEFVNMDSRSEYNLSIRAGERGAKFTHDHKTQCRYVMESLTLWQIVQENIFEFWQVSEDDMIVEGGGNYSFVNTGQGYHRMCDARKSYACMSRCVREAERKMGGWVGIKVIHLGDRDVPNPLVFIDKYTIIPRIVQPIVHTIVSLEKMFDSNVVEEHPGIRNFLRAKYRSYKELRMSILSDFFRHGFDGSGDDGGSCIDGRLTSAWNWCHQLEKKSFYDAFVHTGFTGFD